MPRTPATLLVKGPAGGAGTWRAGGIHWGAAEAHGRPHHHLGGMLSGEEVPPSPLTAGPLNAPPSSAEQRRRPRGPGRRAPLRRPRRRGPAPPDGARDAAYLAGLRAARREARSRPARLALHAAAGPALFFWDSALTSPTPRGRPMGCGARPLISMPLEPSTPAAPRGRERAGRDRKGCVRQWEARTRRPPRQRRCEAGARARGSRLLTRALSGAVTLSVLAIPQVGPEAFGGLQRGRPPAAWKEY